MAGGVYFPEAAPELQQRLDGFLAGLAERLAAAPFARGVTALVLAGGYGRGEGGVFRADDSGPAQLYNDLEFFLLLGDPAVGSAADTWCRREAHAGDAELGIEVEFKLLPAEALRSAGPSMFYYDLVAAHRLVWGDRDFLARLPARLRDPALIPAHECTRLLFNRGSGLFYSRCALAADADPRGTDGFVERNHAKIRLALGDAVLALNGRYHFSCLERGRRIAETPALRPPDWPAIAAWHAEGVDFKLRPRHRRPGRAQLAETQADLGAVWLRTFLWAEGVHLRRDFPDAAAYADAPGRLHPHTGRVRNVLLHARDRLRRGGALPGWTDYPRAALQRALVRLVDPGAGPEALTRAGQALGGVAPAWATLEPAYARWWRCYN
jgi:hypothetical protein